MPSFWRGVIDGDGSVYATGKVALTTASPFLAAQFREFCAARDFVVRGGLAKKGCFDLWLRVAEGRQLLKELYRPGPVPALARKREAAEQVVRRYGI